MPDSNPPTREGLDLRPATEALQALASDLVVYLEADGRRALEVRHPGLPVLLSNFTRLAGVTWQALRVLLSDQHADAHFYVAVGPLVRTLLEGTMTLVFISEDPVPRLVWYFRSGWRDAFELQGRLQTRYGADPQWQARLTGHQGWVSGLERELGIPPEMRTAPDLATPAGWWPNPGKMARLRREPELRRTPQTVFLAHLNEWIYGELSGNSHMAYMGLARTASLLHSTATDEAKMHNRSEVIFRSVALLAALLSEVAVFSGQSWAKERAITAWELLRDSPEAVDLYTRRYQALLRAT